MRTGHWGIITALASLALSAPCYGQEREPEVRPSQEQPDARLEPAASVPKVLPALPSPDGGCKRGVDDRQSDLCAQWKAADAATDAARWTFWTWVASLVGLLIGGGTLFAAWRAAHWAKQAASHTEAGAREARRSADEATRQATEAERSRTAFVQAERAHLSISPSGSPWWDKDSERWLRLPLTISNFGRTSARVHTIQFWKSESLINPIGDDFIGAVRIDRNLAADGEALHDFQIIDFPEVGFISGLVIYDTAFSKGNKYHFGFHVSYFPPSPGFVTARNVDISEAVRGVDWPEDT